MQTLGMKLIAVEDLEALARFFRSENFHGLYVKWFGQPGESAVMFFRLSALPE